MTSTSLCEGCVERFAPAFAAHWGLEVGPLRIWLIGQLNRMAVDLDDERAVEAALPRIALEYRNQQLSPILKELYGVLRARLSHKLGPACHAYRDDAVHQTLLLLLGYWKPWWSRPEGWEHLRRYGSVAVMHTALRLLGGEKAREARLPHQEERHAVDPEAELLHVQGERQRMWAGVRLRDLDWLLEAGLSKAEATAVLRSLGPSPTAGLDQRAEAAWRKALQRAKARLRTLVDKLTVDGGPAAAFDLPAWCKVEHLGLSGRFAVVESTSSGLWLEGPSDEAELEEGAVCMVHVHYPAAVVARGARCVRIERADGKFRIALEYLFRACRRMDSQPTL